MSQSKEQKLAPLYLFGSALLWSLGGIFTKSVAWNGVCLATLRGIIAFVVSGLMLLGHKIHLNPRKILAGFCYFAQSVLLMCANKYTTSANATVLQNTSPFYIILFNAIFARKKTTRAEKITCICLFVGVTLAFMGNLSGGGAFGNVLALLSALFYAGVFFLNKADDVDPMESLFIGNVFFLPLIPVMCADAAVRSTTAHDWGFLIVFAALTGICAWLCFVKGIRHTSALQASFITMAEPVLAPVWTFLFLGEVISPLSVVGCVFVVCTLLTYNIRIAKCA